MLDRLSLRRRGSSDRHHRHPSLRGDAPAASVGGTWPRAVRNGRTPGHKIRPGRKANCRAPPRCTGLDAVSLPLRAAPPSPPGTKQGGQPVQSLEKTQLSAGRKSGWNLGRSPQYSWAGRCLRAHVHQQDLRWRPAPPPDAVSCAQPLFRRGRTDGQNGDRVMQGTVSSKLNTTEFFSRQTPVSCAISSNRILLAWSVPRRTTTSNNRPNRAAAAAWLRGSGRQSDAAESPSWGPRQFCSVNPSLP